MKYSQPPGTPDNSSYVDFNPAQGIEGSVVPAAAIEAPQREIVKVIMEAGLEPAGGDLTQLYEAIKALFHMFLIRDKGQLLSAADTRGNDYSDGDSYTVPSYVVGGDQLDIFWNGLHCTLGRQYEEVGTVGDTATTITLLHDLVIADAYDVYVRPR